MINEIKYAYIAVTEMFSAFFSWERKNEEHLLGLMKRLVLLFKVKPKREKIDNLIGS